MGAEKQPYTEISFVEKNETDILTFQTFDVESVTKKKDAEFFKLSVFLLEISEI